MSIHNGNTRGSFRVGRPDIWVGIALTVTFGPVVLGLLVGILHWAWTVS